MCGTPQTLGLCVSISKIMVRVIEIVKGPNCVAEMKWQ